MATILIVDDDPINRELLHAYLEGYGHRLIDADSGERALELAAESRPDLVLLDVMMPGIDGFETTARLKRANAKEFLPIVLITALSDQAARVRGLRAGADEFLSKPVDRHELLLRTTNLLALRDKEISLLRRNVELIELQRFRDEMSEMIVHDLKNPLSVILSNLEYVVTGGALDTDRLEALMDSKSAGQRALRLLAGLIDVAKLEAGHFHLRRSTMGVAQVVEPLVSQRVHLAGARGIKLTTEIDRDARMNADVDLISRVIDNVFDNALRHTPSGGRIAVCCSARPDCVLLRVGNTGHAIPVEHRTRIFDKFAQSATEVGRMNLGLGLYFCRLAAEAHGGRIWVDETPELPTVFGLEIPHLAQPPNAL